MRTLKTIFAAGLLLLSTVLVSCEKCKIEGENTDNGLIVKDVIIYPPSGNITTSMAGQYHISAENAYAQMGGWQISFDKGYTKENLDFNQYSVLALPMRVNCGGIFERTVTQDVNGQITYTVNAQTCKTCEHTWYVENYVLIPAQASDQVINYNPVIIEK